MKKFTSIFIGVITPVINVQEKEVWQLPNQPSDLKISEYKK